MRNLPEKAEFIKENGLYVNTPKGNSMWPFIRGERDVISVIPVKEPLKKYQVILYEIPGRGHILHRILAVREHGYVVRGDNCFYKEYVSKDRSYLPGREFPKGWRNGKYPQKITKKSKK